MQKEVRKEGNHRIKELEPGAALGNFCHQQAMQAE
jgi:hypothetical protein